MPAKGKAIRWTAEDLDRLAQVSPEDVEEAKVGWQRDAPPRFRPLLDAEPMEELRAPGTDT